MSRAVTWLLGVVSGGGSLALSLNAWAVPPKMTRVGDQQSALPGLARVGLPVAAERGLRLGSAAGYGFTETVGNATGPHHRIGGTVALGAVVTPWLQLAGRLDGRFDLHPNDPGGADSGAVGDPRLLARVGTWMTDALALGGELGLWVPGSDAPSFELGATTVDGSALLSWSASRSWTVAMRAGYRLDNSAKSIGSPEQLSFGDRLALGVSDADAVLAGVGASYRLNSLELIAEVSADLLVGSEAPPLADSPMRIAAGLRYHTSRALQLGLVTNTSLSARPDVSPNAPLVPVEPRFGATATLVYRFGVEPDEPRDLPPSPQEAEEPTRAEEEPTRAEEERKTAPAEEPTAEDEKAAPSPTPVVVKLENRRGKPVDKAWVRVVTPDGQTLTLKPGSEPGAYRAESIPPGEATLVVTADGIADFERAVTFDAPRSGQPMKLDVELDPAASGGQIRGLIRSFSGDPIEASIEIEPIQEKIETGPDGTFSVDVPPGSYTVTIRGKGYRTQIRRVRVERDGVVVLNAELVKSR